MSSETRPLFSSKYLNHHQYLISKNVMGWWSTTQRRRVPQLLQLRTSTVLRSQSLAINIFINHYPFQLSTLFSTYKCIFLYCKSALSINFSVNKNGSSDTNWMILEIVSSPSSIQLATAQLADQANNRASRQPAIKIPPILSPVPSNLTKDK